MTTQCNSIHKSILEQFKHAVVWGRSVKHQGQLCGLTHVLEDEDISAFQHTSHGIQLTIMLVTIIKK